MSTRAFNVKIKNDLNCRINKSNVFPSSKCHLINVGVTNETNLKWRLGDFSPKQHAWWGQGSGVVAFSLTVMCHCDS